MISFRDRTYCPYFNTCQNGNSCKRALTDSVKRDAEIWWDDFMNGKEDRGEPPICVYADKPECYKEIDSGNK